MELTPKELEVIDDSFEALAEEKQGTTLWSASKMAEFLGYKNLESFKKVIEKTTKVFSNIGVPAVDNIIKDGDDYQMTRFACYLAVMNANPKYPEVAKAQVYFAERTRQFELLMEENDREAINRILFRGELIEANKSLNSAAKEVGVEQFQLFQHAGYMGLYNMSNKDLAARRGIDPKMLLEHMGRTELAVNLFRVTQTEEHLKSKNVKGQGAAENAHKQIGAAVRDMVKKNTGKNPESLPVERKLPQIKSEVKKSKESWISRLFSSTKTFILLKFYLVKHFW